MIGETPNPALYLASNPWTRSIIPTCKRKNDKQYFYSYKSPLVKKKKADIESALIDAYMFMPMNQRCIEPAFLVADGYPPLRMNER